MIGKPFTLRPTHILVWEKLKAFKEVYGFSPGYKQMCDGCKIARGTLARIYRELESIGAITRQKGRRNAIETVTHPAKLTQQH